MFLKLCVCIQGQVLCHARVTIFWLLSLSIVVKPLINSEHGNAEGARNQQAGGLGILCRPFKGLCSADAVRVPVYNDLDKK